MKHIPRFFIDSELFSGKKICLTSEQMHHFSKVLRIPAEGKLRVFNNRCEEWNCEIFDVKKRSVICKDLYRSVTKEEGPIIICSLINPSRLFILLEKVTELGVSEIVPVITQYAQYKSFNMEKAKQVIIQACAQSQRLTIPALHGVTNIEDFLINYNYNCKILVGDEMFCGNRLCDVLEEKCAFLIGSEGGFSDKERNLFAQYSFVRSFGYGSNILRSETAAIAFASVWSDKFS